MYGHPHIRRIHAAGEHAGSGHFQDAFRISPWICVLLRRRCWLEQIVPEIDMPNFTLALDVKGLLNAHYLESKDGQANETGIYDFGVGSREGRLQCLRRSST
jgi:hypothetical protein